MTYHNAPAYLLNPEHKITVDLIGLGGTGSQVLTMLGRMDSALRALGHPGLHVRGWDPDVVSESNLGRQLFSPADLAANKAVCLITRINRFFGQNWEAWPYKYGVRRSDKDYRKTSNITITCVDTIAARRLVNDLLTRSKKSHTSLMDSESINRILYWLDFGNGQKTGQVVLGTPLELISKDKEVQKLKTVFELFPDFQSQKDEDSGSSCSMAEALGKQDLFINSTLANLGMAILWKLFREGRISSQGAFLNLETLSLSPINL